MEDIELRKHLQKHKKYLAKDQYMPEYSSEFIRLFYSNTFSKIGYWLIALAEGDLKPLTEKQKIYVQHKDNLKMKIGTDGKLHSETYEN